MKETIRIIIIVLLFVVLFLVRAFEDQLFYDPLNSYFQNDYLYKKIPQLDRWNLLLHLFYRYTINSLISLAIIYMVFRNKKIIKFSQLFFTVAFLLLIVLLFLVRAFEEQLFYDPLNSYFQNDYLYKKIPSLDRWNLLLHLFYRYIVNSLISLAIIHLVFRNKKIIKFSQLFFAISFLVLIVAFFF